jgi:hypothetical protein
MNTNLFNGMMGPVQPGLCRMTPNGKIGIKTHGGYKTYDVKTGRLTNCANFVFDLGEEFFFVIPTNHLKVGDIILVNGSPRCVIEVKKNEITTLNYENSTKECVIPERHIFYGKSYMYGKIVSPMGNLMKGNNIMKYAMISEMMKHFNGNKNLADTFYNGLPNTNKNTNDNNMMNNMMGNMMYYSMMGSMFGEKNNLFEGMFDFEEEDDENTSVFTDSIDEKEND